MTIKYQPTVKYENSREEEKNEEQDVQLVHLFLLSAILHTQVINKVQVYECVFILAGVNISLWQSTLTIWFDLIYIFTIKAYDY